MLAVASGVRLNVYHNGGGGGGAGAGSSSPPGLPENMTSLRIDRLGTGSSASSGVKACANCGGAGKGFKTCSGCKTVRGLLSPPVVFPRHPLPLCSYPQAID